MNDQPMSEDYEMAGLRLDYETPLSVGESHETLSRVLDARGNQVLVFGRSGPFMNDAEDQAMRFVEFYNRRPVGKSSQ